MAYELADSVIIQAAPERIYDVVSDVTRTGEWSPVCYRCEWSSEARGVGATFVGHNRTPDREWSTTSTVVVATPGIEFAWEVGAGRTRWGYRMAPAAGRATELTEYTVFGAAAEEAFRERFGAAAETEEENRRRAAASGIPVTLQRIKAMIEAR